MPADRAASPQLLESLHRGGQLTDAALARALELSCASPGPQRWRQFLDWLLLGLGAALVLVGVILLVAFNWAALPPLVKLALAAALLAGAAYAASRLGLEALPGRVALTGAAVLIGPLLALYGQTYQTGADPYSLFVAWAALAALWVAIARFPALWLIELLLVNVALGLWWDQVWMADEWRSNSERSLTVLLAFVDAAAWVAWELGAWRKVPWMQSRWLPRVLAVATLGMSFTVGVEVLIHSRYHSIDLPEVAGLVLHLSLAGAMLWFFHRVRRDLFMVAAALAAVMTCATTFVGNAMSDSHFDLGVVFLLGLMVIGEVAAAAWWLRSKHRAWGAP